MDMLTRKIARNLARELLTQASADDEDFVFKMEFADGLLRKVAEEERLEGS